MSQFSALASEVVYLTFFFLMPSLICARAKISLGELVPTYSVSNSSGSRRLSVRARWAQLFLRTIVHFHAQQFLSYNLPEFSVIYRK